MNSTQLESSLAFKYTTRVRATENDKESTLLQYRMNTLVKSCHKIKVSYSSKHIMLLTSLR
jgi:hypothetical protein